MTEKICRFIYWLYKNEIDIKDDVDYIKSLYAEFDIEEKTTKKSE